MLGSALPPARAKTDPTPEGAACAHLVAQVVSSAGQDLPARKRMAFEWRHATISGPGEKPLVLRWAEIPADVRPTRLRISVAIDERDEKVVRVFLPGSGRTLGTIAVRFASYFQPYELAIAPVDLDAIRREGVALDLASGSPLEVIVSGRDAPPELLPHLLIPGSRPPADEFLDRIASLSSIQPFGWMEGCVLDGLLDLGDRPAGDRFRVAARRHLDLFFRDGRLIYENHVSEPADGRIYGIEGTLPFAALARVEPDAPALDLALRFWLAHRDADGLIIDGSTTTSEGAYTVGYPLAMLARTRGDDQLERLALTQIGVRQGRLFDGESFVRTRGANGRTSDRDWSRGVAWQMLGMARTLAILADRAEARPIVAEFARMAGWIQGHQRADGLWGVIVSQPDLTADTGGCAGIAAALAIGAKHGWLDPTAKSSARKVLDALQRHLTPDGFLTGVSQSNKGGEAIQRSDYRVIYQMGMGLMAQLLAALDSAP
jgi:hypothetical protein